MNQVLCSTGALLGRPNNRDYRLLDEITSKLNCDGYEFMVYGSWYPEIDKLISSVKKLELNIPVIHAQKTLGETLCGIRVEEDETGFHKYMLTEQEDQANFRKGLEEFKINLQVAGEFGADRMVLHLWNGLASDKNLQKNIERFGILRDMAADAGVLLMVENVVCNTNDPLNNLREVYKQYPDVSFVYDTKMAEFHRQTLDVFEDQWSWIWDEGHIRHLHINDYDGGYMDWANLRVLPIGRGHVDFETFFNGLHNCNYCGDYTVEATGFSRNREGIDCDMLNDCFGQLREYIKGV